MKTIIRPENAKECRATDIKKDEVFVRCDKCVGRCRFTKKPDAMAILKVKT